MSPDEQQPQKSLSAGQYPILIEISSEEDLPEIPFASRNKTNSDITTSTTIIQDLSSDKSDEFEDVNVSYIGRRKYIHGLVFENTQVIKCVSVPPDIDDTVVYEVPIGSSGKLTHCKGLRPWGYAQSSKSKEFKNDPRLLFNCRGSYCWKNIKYLNISDFGVDRVEFQKKDDQTICSLCGDQAAFIPCTGRLTLEKETNVKKITCKHYGTHPCLLERKGRNKDVEDIARSFPRVTRESFIRQKVQQKLEENSFRDAVETAKSLTDKTFIDNVRRKEKSRRRPDGHCFEAVELLQKHMSKRIVLCCTHIVTALHYHV